MRTVGEPENFRIVHVAVRMMSALFQQSSVSREAAERMNHFEIPLASRTTQVGTDSSPAQQAQRAEAQTVLSIFGRQQQTIVE